MEHRGQTAEEIGETEQNEEHLIPDVSWLTLDVCKQFCKNARNIGIQYGNKLSLDEATMQVIIIRPQTLRKRMYGHAI